MPWTILIYDPRRAPAFAEMLEPVLSSSASHRLIPCTTRAEVERSIAEADILLCWRFPADLLPRATRLRWLQALSAGVDDLVKAPLPEGVPLTRVEGLFGSYMSEYAFAHMLAHAQQLRRLYAAQADRHWEHFNIGKLAGKRLGVAGVGAIGQEVARKGKAFGMEVWGLARTRREVDHVDRLFTSTEAALFTAGVDCLVSSLPDTPESRGLIDPEGMKQGALLINMGRGATIDEGAILRAVRSGRIQAVLDVFPQEPLPVDHPFWTEPGITVTPHLSGPTVPTEMAAYFVANLGRFERGEPLVGLVDRARGY